MALADIPGYTADTPIHNEYQSLTTPACVLHEGPLCFRLRVCTLVT